MCAVGCHHQSCINEIEWDLPEMMEKSRWERRSERKKGGGQRGITLQTSQLQNALIQHDIVIGATQDPSESYSLSIQKKNESPQLAKLSLR